MIVLIFKKLNNYEIIFIRIEFVMTTIIKKNIISRLKFLLQFYIFLLQKIYKMVWTRQELFVLINERRNTNQVNIGYFQF